MTDKIDFDVKRSEVELTGVVLEDLFPTNALPTDGSDCGESYLVGTSCGEIAFLNDRRTGALRTDELCENVLFACVTGYELRPKLRAQVIARVVE